MSSVEEVFTPEYTVFTVLSAVISDRTAVFGPLTEPLVVHRAHMNKLEQSSVQNFRRSI